MTPASPPLRSSHRATASRRVGERRDRDVRASRWVCPSDVGCVSDPGRTCRRVQTEEPVRSEHPRGGRREPGNSRVGFNFFSECGGLTPRYKRGPHSPLSYTRVTLQWRRRCQRGQGTHRQGQGGELVLGRRLVGLSAGCGQVVVVVWSLSRVRLFVTPWTVRGILQAGTLEWVAVFFSGGSSRPGDRAWVSCVGRRVLYP